MIPSYKLVLFSISLLSCPFTLRASDPTQDLPPDLKRHILLYLDINDIARMGRVSKKWLKATHQKELWIDVSKRMNAGIFLEKDIKELALDELMTLVKKHYLSVLVNIKDNPAEIYRLVHVYQLQGYHAETLSRLFSNIARPFYGLSSEEDKKELCAQRRDPVISSLTSPSKEGREYSNHKEAKLARDINDWLVLQGDDEAINRQIEGAIYGFHGYEIQGWDKAHDLIEHFAAQGSDAAIIHTIKGYTLGYTGYKADYTKGKELIETLVRKESDQGLIYKADALFHGRYGYPKNVSAARALYMQVVQKGGKLASRATIFAGIRVPEKSHKEKQPERLSLEEKKLISDLVNNRSSPSLMIEIAALEAKGSPLGYYLKALGIKYGIFGFSKNRPEALNYIKKHWVPF